ncbi:MAG: spondin domain-containing protein, partial [Microcystaceae cyanobacterium]
MNNKYITKFNSRKTIIAAMIAVGSILMGASTASAVKLKVTVKNLAPEKGTGMAAVWFGLHDGSFNPFNQGQAASEAIEFLAEDGLVGLEEIVLPGVLKSAVAAGLNPSKLPLAAQQAIALGLDLSTLPPPPGTIAGDFFTSPASINGGTQGMVVTSIRKNPFYFDLLDDPSAFPQAVLDSIKNPFFFVQAPGETETATVTLKGTAAQNRYFSFAAMVFPTNDGFIANDDPQAIEIFNESGAFLGANFI